MKKIFVYLVVCLLAYLFIPAPKSLAAGEFQADYNVDYTIAPSGAAIVTQEVALTNKETNFYPRQYSIVIDTDKISDVIARDDGGVIVPLVTQTGGKTAILLNFNQKVVGLGKKLRFTLRFQNRDIAWHNGSIWEINIPGVTPDTDLASYNVSLEVPDSFGPEAYVYPQPASGRFWIKDQMLKGGISAAYGSKQIFNLDLDYYLENPKVTPLAADLALPPDTAFQKVEITDVSPKPENVTRDADGNWLAHYVILPGIQLRVKAKAIAEIYFKPRPGVSENLLDKGDYLKPQQYWESDNPKIEELAKQYKTARSIYDYVVNTLTYNYNLVNQNPVRKGAVAALSAPDQSICTEFADLFIAVARAAGIPAREDVGYAYTTNSKLRPLSLVSDILHAWPEYYDPTRKLWIPVDPTWGNTTGGVDYFDKLDFNHIVFAIEGKQSNYPYPAGFYRDGSTTGKNVNVTFGSQSIDGDQGKLSLSFNFPHEVTAGFDLNGSVILENSSGLAVDSADVAIQASRFAFSLTKKENNIPPFAKVAYPFSLKTNGWFTKATGQISASVNGRTNNFYFSVQPFYWLLVPLVLLAAGVLLLGYLFFAKMRLWKTRKTP